MNPDLKKKSFQILFYVWKKKFSGFKRILTRIFIFMCETFSFMKPDFKKGYFFIIEKNIYKFSGKSFSSCEKISGDFFFPCLEPGDTMFFYFSCMKLNDKRFFVYIFFMHESGFFFFFMCETRWKTSCTVHGLVREAIVLLSCDNICALWWWAATYGITERVGNKTPDAQPCQTVKISFQWLHSCKVLGKNFTSTQESAACLDFMITSSQFRATCVHFFSTARQEQLICLEKVLIRKVFCWSVLLGWKLAQIWFLMAHTWRPVGWRLSLEQVGHNCRHVVYIAWELVSTVSKTRAWVENNQM